MPNLTEQAFLAVQRKARCFFLHTVGKVGFFPTLHNLRNSWIYLLKNFSVKSAFQMRINMKNLKRIFRQQAEEMLGSQPWLMPLLIGRAFRKQGEDTWGNDSIRLILCIARDLCYLVRIVSLQRESKKKGILCRAEFSSDSAWKGRLEKQQQHTFTSIGIRSAIAPWVICHVLTLCPIKSMAKLLK